MVIKNGKLNYDQSGRAYPDNPEIHENWNCIWENNGKYYKLVGDNEHKEWEEVNIYNKIIGKAYKNYCKKYWETGFFHEKINYGSSYYDHETNEYIFEELSKEEFINKIKTDLEFSEKWGLKIEERELNDDERVKLYEQKTNRDTSFFPVLRETLNFHNIPTKLIAITYNNETIEVYGI